MNTVRIEYTNSYDQRCVTETNDRQILNHIITEVRQLTNRDIHDDVIAALMTDDTCITNHDDIDVKISRVTPIQLEAIVAVLDNQLDRLQADYDKSTRRSRTAMLTGKIKAYEYIIDLLESELKE